jgi:hypothetical protein
MGKAGRGLSRRAKSSAKSKRPKRSATATPSRRKPVKPASSSKNAKRQARKDKRKKASPKLRASRSTRLNKRKAKATSSRSARKPTRLSARGPSKKYSRGNPLRRGLRPSRGRSVPNRTRPAKTKQLDRKARERLKKQRERERLLKARLQEKLRKQRDAERARKQKEIERARRAREQQAQRTVRAREALKRAKDEEKRRKNHERDSKRQAEIRAREEDRRRKQQLRDEAKRAKEEERQRQKAEREAEREQVRRQKEEERAKREAEREAYRKAKEAERERLRATREAQKRALEGRIAEANRNANKLGGGRSTTTRFYSPRAIPNQSGTTRRVSDTSNSASNPTAFSVTQGPETQSYGRDAGNGAGAAPFVGEEAPRAPTLPERPLPTAESVEERYRIIDERLKEAPADFRHGYQEALDMSWIYHDSALEGVVYTFQELRAAIDQGSGAVADSSLQPVVEEVRRHKAAIDLVRELGEKKRAPITVDVIRKIYLTLHPEEGDLKTVRYRRDVPQHRLYFHEYSHPEKIQHKVRQIVDWLNGPEPKKLKSPIRVASRAHYELLRVFPFQSDSGKVARLFMNLLLLRAGHPPAIVHSTERQRYYEALRGALPTLIQMVTESILNGLVSIEKLLDEQELKARTSTS